VDLGLAKNAEPGGTDTATQGAIAKDVLLGDGSAPLISMDVESQQTLDFDSGVEAEDDTMTAEFKDFHKCLQLRKAFLKELEEMSEAESAWDAFQEFMLQVQCCNQHIERREQVYISPSTKSRSMLLFNSLEEDTRRSMRQKD
jgi:hypothetical protein